MDSVILSAAQKLLFLALNGQLTRQAAQRSRGKVLAEGEVRGLAEQVHQEVPADCVAGGAAPRVPRVRPARVLPSAGRCRGSGNLIIIVQLILMLHLDHKSPVSALTSAVTIGKVSEISKILIRQNILYFLQKGMQ